ncbi:MULTISPECIES: dipeptide ABC transporter ATP-binding protein [Paenibacillus]|uniref:dipeptide ABC transporter ATP-binding protein n=1 Tax=Paenibacillus TaxID=44249 RepID=UPI0022B87E2F|nr:ABC transporter ATP-binding protein [Paenibacillus caseinilyticus]MCZ8521714.1 ABC transporter ATP-binding protein [Paenibacillus caseinilyticus]
MTKPLLELERISVDFLTEEGPVTALSDLSLQVLPGETLCLVGESGSGKTLASKTVMRLVEFENGLISKGNIWFGEEDVSTWSQERMRSVRGKRAAMIFQEPMAAFDPVFTVGQQLVEAIVQHGDTSAQEAWQHGVHLLGRVGIPEPELRMKQYPGELSGGMLQRAMIAMALSCGPELLIADEPTTALDVTVQAQILLLLQELKEEFGMSILLVTHDLGIAAEMADRVAVMYAGRIVEEARTEELFEQPLHPYTKGLLASVASGDSPRGSRLPSIEGSIPALTDLPEGCRFHPRCPHAVNQCLQSDPPLAVYDGGRRTACWRTEELEVERLVEQALAEAGPAPARLQPAGGEVQVLPGREDAPEDRAATRPLLFEVKELRKAYPLGGGLLRRPKGRILAVDGVSFTIRAGETFGLVGESGSGKSTLGRTLLRLEKPTEGQVLFEGRDLAKLSPASLREARRGMQVIFQDPYGSLNPRWTVGELVGEGLAVHGTAAGSERKERVAELLSAVGLRPEWSSRYPHEFSGGQRQRIGIARAMALQPKFILADEAVSALDVSVQAQILNLLQELQQREGLTYLFIGHGLQAVRHMSDRIGVMYLGRLAEVAPSGELFRRPAHPYTAALLASIPHGDPKRRGQMVPLAGEIPSPASPPSGCRFHPRCPAARPICREAEPPWQEIGPDHAAACHFPL